MITELMRKGKLTKYFLVIILLAAAFLRLWRLSEVPVSLFGDELDVGYHAYSILKTGKDYSGNFMPLHFQSLAEWRTPLYLYSVVPTVALFGISAWGVRLPAAIFGILGVWGMYLMVGELLNFFGSGKRKTTDAKNEVIALLSAGVLTFSPWHIQYSRAAFEVTMLLAFFIFGFYFFFKSLRKEKGSGRWLWISAALLTLTPLIYSTAKLFAPIIMLALILFWGKRILKLERKHLVWAFAAAVIAGMPTAYATLFGGGTQRFGYIGVFTDPTIEPEVGTARMIDAQMRGEVHLGLKPSFTDRMFHNKVVFWVDNITRNYFESFSSEFLFYKGDRNPRHSIEGVGQFYQIEALAMLVGLIVFFAGDKDKKLKVFMTVWILAGVLPASITRDGGMHATRLILILPPLVFFVAYGISKTLVLTKGMTRYILIGGYLMLFAYNFIFYQHNYWVHNPWHSERWWHAGFKEVVASVVELDEDYERVFISMSGEPAWIFFAAWSQYPPDQWHQGYPFDDTVVEGFGRISYIDKYYFGSPVADVVDIYSLHEYISKNDMYMANASEIGENLIREPHRTPAGLKLLRSITYPSGEPAFYLFAGTK